ncbi:MAG: hypothetical protein E7514_04720 [Ruminococcaceae bacterium]|nr:hypothetical protein [Oscillospiraceae bacterium]
MFKAAGLALIASGFIVYIKTVKPELSFLIRIGGICAVFTAVYASFEFARDRLDYLISLGDSEIAFVRTALKITAVCLVTQTAADICRDCNETALATGTETVGKVLILALAFPVIENILKFGLALLGG